MKRLTVALLIAMLASLVGLAQSTDLGRRHHITASVNDNFSLTLVGFISNKVTKAYFEEGRLGPHTIKDSKSKGSFSLGYNFKLNERISLGADLTYAAAGYSIYVTRYDRLLKKKSIEVIMAMAMAQLKYYQSGYMTIYGRAGGGIMKDLKGASCLALQIDAFDFEFGTDRLAGFIRMGFGVKGFASIGVQVGI